MLALFPALVACYIKSFIGHYMYKSKIPQHLLNGKVFGVEEMTLH